MENFDDILDESLDDIADLPPYRAFANGVHKVVLGFSTKPTEDDKKPKPYIVVRIKLVETLELADASETPMEIGTESTVQYDMNNAEYGAPSFKALVAPLSEALQTKSIKEIMERGNGMEVVVTTKQRFAKDDKKKETPYTNITSLHVV